MRGVGRWGGDAAARGLQGARLALGGFDDRWPRWPVDGAPIVDGMTWRGDEGNGRRSATVGHGAAG
eukprot:5841764-Prymnesium_polylepis.1